MKITKDKISSDTIVRVFITALTYLQSFIFIPIIAKGLGAEQYGMWSQVIATLGLLTPLLSMSLMSACIRYFPAKKNKKFISHDLFSMLAIIWVVLLPFSLVSFLLRGKLSFLLFGRSNLTTYVEIFLILLFARITFAFIHSYYRSRNRIKTYSIIQTAQIILEIALAIVLVTYLNLGLLGAMFALIFIEAFFSMFMLFHIIREIGFLPKLNFIELRKYLRFSLPLIPNVLLVWIMNLSDRYVITHLLGLEQAGIYAASYQIGRLVRIFIGPISFGFRPAASILWDRGEKKKLAKYMRKSLQYYFLFAIPTIFGLYHLSPFVLREFAGKNFVTPRLLVLFVALGMVIYGMNQITYYPINLAEKTKYLAPVSFLSASLNLGLNFWLIPKWGIIAAAISTFLCYALRSATLLVIAYRIFPFHFDFRFLTKAIVAAGSMFLMLRLFSPESLFQIAGVVIFGIAVYFGIMMLIRGIGNEEWILVKSAMRNLRSQV
ncbi:MAG: oligosaccharide flippase family protein [Candidatus Heimdallarchaeaceae archaeon]